MILNEVLGGSWGVVRRELTEYTPTLAARETGRVVHVGQGVAMVRGLANVQSEELVRFPNGVFGIAANLESDEVGVMLLDRSASLHAGQRVRRTGRVCDVPIGEGLLGRVVDAVGRPLDGRGAIRREGRRAVERDAPPIMDRAPVSVPLETGIKVIDAVIPIGRGQRQLILGDRQTGKTAVAVDALTHQRDGDVIGVYCAVGQRGSAVARVIHDLRRHGAMDRCVVVVSSGEDPPGLQFTTPYAATTIAEFFMERGADVLVVYDDLTRHARAYRQLSLLLRRPPGREAYPGDIFYVHSRLLERSTRLRPERGGGSLTALPIVETDAQNLSAYIPTNLISITDGQIYLSPDLFQKGTLPAVDVGKSVSRVGGRAQLAAFRSVAADLRLAYAQFEELEAFSRFGTRLDPETRARLERGRRVREVLKQQQYEGLDPGEQVAVLLAAIEGLFDGLAVETVVEAERVVRRGVADVLKRVGPRVLAGTALAPDDRAQLIEASRNALRDFHAA